MRKLMIFAVLCLLALTSSAQNVTNVRFEQEGKMVRIYYDLSEEADISIYLSTDGGKTYESSPLGHLSGHAGEEVTAGTNRCAVWDVLADREKLQNSNVSFKVVAARHEQYLTFTVKGVQFTMVYVQGGTFKMGCTSNKQDCDEAERAYSNPPYHTPVHDVILDGYYLGQTEVTQALWLAVMGSIPSDDYYKGDDYPVYGTLIDDVMEFISRLNVLTGQVFRLPTEAEWEYAARGGNKSNGYKYSGSNNLDAVAWYKYNSGGRVHPVAQKAPNELGLFDMSGNVQEWTNDTFGKYSENSQINPSYPDEKGGRVLRGGNWWSNPIWCTVWKRNDCNNSYPQGGLRLVMIR